MAPPANFKKNIVNEPKLWELYVVSGGASFALCLAEKLSGGFDSRLASLSQITWEWFSVEGEIWAILLVISLGLFFTWVRKPEARVDAFTIGGSVFAVLTMLASPASVFKQASESPLQNNMAAFLAKESEESKVRILFGTAYAGDEKANANGKVFIILQHLKNAGKNPGVFVTVRNKDTSDVVFREKVEGYQFSFKGNNGKYLVTTETDNFRSTTSEISIGDGSIQVYSINSEPSEIPVYFQRLIPTENNDAKLVEYRAYIEEGKALANSGNFDKAIEKYEAAKSIMDSANEKDDYYKLLNYIGYAYLKLGKEDDAIKNLGESIKVNPYITARLNLAKAYCFGKDKKNAMNAILTGPKLSDSDINSINNDGELRTFCENDFAREMVDGLISQPNN
ncbi:MAG: hypothetical protein A3G18_13270 [Rhodospirillales bacterium RIFCSPLOWO2_12_FULL_58_28]|nr:MAG: hypothetical protein A3H92_13125 [Rhodospirillales bacterium RIFCSPLOWO2_02_FULL_58_16]OHC78549.1 MAG: hypothetical protein A3G18_13270 [Rhodospirillales bacterium RIFCSPLOWO2_12_FULL_58_28]